MNASHQRLAVEAFRWNDDRPFALRQAKRDVLLDDVLLMRIDIEALLNRRFRGFDLLMIGQDAGDLLQRRSGVADRIAVDGDGPDCRRPPHFDGAVRGARPLQEAAEIDVGRNEIRVERDRLLQRIDRRRRVARIAVESRAVEIGHIKQRMLRVGIDPDLIELTR